MYSISKMFNSLFSFYRSKEWEKLREVLRLERLDDNGNLLCEHCHKPIVNSYDAICHHKEPLTELNVNDYNISLNPDNIMVVHHKCHNEIHKRFGTYTRHIYIVYGSPCAGKTTYVNDNALRDDLIIDIDRIFSCINNSRSNRVYPNVMQLYRQLIDMVKTRNGQWINAWIVRGFPNKSEREMVARDLNAELIFIDTPQEICEARAIARGGNEYKKYVDEWFNNYVG